MSHPTEPIAQILQFYTTAQYPCSYLPDRSARSEVAAPAHLVDTAAYSRLITQGFRRSGLFTYRPQCGACRACVPIRIDAARFQPRRSHRRAARHHQDLRVRVLPLAWNDEHFELYTRYQAARHPGEGMDQDTEKQYRQFLLTSGVESSLVEFRDPERGVQMVCLVDILHNGLSAVYTFFDPTAQGSLGTWGVIWQIRQCQRLGLPWLYLGYWIQDSPKMSYKAQFRPCQVLHNGRWQDAFCNNATN